MRDFFGQQDQARTISGRLAAILAGSMIGTILATALALATVATVLAFLQVVLTTDFPVSLEYWVDVFANRCIGFGMLVGAILAGTAVYRTLNALELGGVELARQFGAKQVHAVDAPPCHQQLINIVEELSIAANLSRPKIFLLEQESEINAFAAGIEPNDTVVGVTQGALEHLNRSQLQGVLAHEFSHIINQDVQLNVRTLGILQGIELVTSAANRLLQMGISQVVNGSMLATVFGTVLWPVGQIGAFFGSLAKMSLNRQREFLADAVAVQLTRDAQGLSSALQVIAGRVRQGTLLQPTARTASHLFFSAAAPPVHDWLRSHPPLEARIRRLDPAWDGRVPLSLPDETATLIAKSDNDSLEETLSAGQEPLFGDQSAHQPTIAASPGDLSALTTPSADAGADEAQEAFLRTLGKVRANSNREVYDPNTTHWPTLAATAAAVVCASAVFSWLIS